MTYILTQWCENKTQTNFEKNKSRFSVRVNDIHVQEKTP